MTRKLIWKPNDLFSYAFKIEPYLVHSVFNRKFSIMYRVLFIEDDLVDQMAAMRVLKKAKLNLQVHNVNNIAEGLLRLQTQSFDLIISDYHLADGTAVDLAQYIQHIPLILITGLRVEDLVQQAKSIGAAKFIRKDQTLNYLEALPNIIRGILPLDTATNLASTQQIGATDLPQEGPKISLDKLTKLFDHNQDAIGEIIIAFLAQDPVDMQELQAALEAKDLEQIRKIAHKVKSRYQMFGLKPQAVTASSIEEQIALEQYSWVDIHAKIQLLQHSAKSIYHQLKKYLPPNAHYN